MDGQTGLRLAIKAAAVGSFNLRLARELTLDSVVSRQFGRLLAIRGLNQNTIIVQLPEVATRGSVLDIVVSYQGRLAPQAATREALTAGAQQPPNRPPIEDTTPLAPEPSWLYSNNSLWYAQSTVSDYATARLRLSVPDGWGSVASGSISDPAALLPPDERSRGIAWRETTFVATQPVRYLSWTVSRFEQAAETSVSLNPTPSDRLARVGGMGFQKLDVQVVANARQLGRGREVATRAVAILNFYGSLLTDFPYPTLTLAIVEDNLPGGHSPPYFAQLHQPPPLAPVIWRNDPVFFSGFPDFFLAHEVAHQWWGQAVGWRNFHEQWLSEGFAQYFAVLYAQSHRPEAFSSILRQLRRWSINESDQGPVYLGYRLGHIKSDSRVFRALVYDKGAAVLHMLRRLVGDEAFFRSVRRFYMTWRFRKAGTEDLRAIFEAETKQSLERFFAGWIYGQQIPQIRFGWRVEGSEAVLTFDQLGDEVFVVPVTVSLQFADRTTRDETIIVDYKTVDVRLPIDGTLRSIDVNRDEAALAEFVR
jgi:Peptidase family M1 domain